MRIYTRRGDSGSTQLRSGERVAKNDEAIELVGAIDEAQAALGLARAECRDDDVLDELVASIERDLWILMAEVTTAPGADTALVPGETAIDAPMVERLERAIDETTERLEAARAFAVPGDNRLSAALDVARTIVRRAERRSVGVDSVGPEASAYLNRLSDLCWVLARAAEDEHRTNKRRRAGRELANKGSPS